MQGGEEVEAGKFKFELWFVYAPKQNTLVECSSYLH